MNEYQLFRVVYKKGSPHIKFYGISKCKQDELQDEPLVLNINDTNKTNVLLQSSYKSYTLTAEAYICNIPHPYIASTVKYPVYYLSFIYFKQFIKGRLFSIYIYFDITKESKDLLIKNPRNLISSRIQGNYYYTITLDEGLSNKFLNHKLNEIETNVLHQNLTNADTLNKQELFDQMAQTINSQFKAYEEMFKDKPINQENINFNYIINLMTDLAKMPIINELIVFIMNIREEERKQKYNTDIYNIENIKSPNKTV
jgi:hypothetical protein